MPTFEQPISEGDVITLPFGASSVPGVTLSYFWTVTDGTAHLGSDYVVSPSASSSQVPGPVSITVGAVQDGDAEGAEDFYLNLTLVSDAGSGAVLDEPLTFHFTIAASAADPELQKLQQVELTGDLAFDAAMGDAEKHFKDVESRLDQIDAQILREQAIIDGLNAQKQANMIQGLQSFGKLARESASLALSLLPEGAAAGALKSLYDGVKAYKLAAVDPIDFGSAFLKFVNDPSIATGSDALTKFVSPLASFLGDKSFYGQIFTTAKLIQAEINAPSSPDLVPQIQQHEALLDQLQQEKLALLGSSHSLFGDAAISGATQFDPLVSVAAPVYSATSSSFTANGAQGAVTGVFSSGTVQSVNDSLSVPHEFVLLDDAQVLDVAAGNILVEGQAADQTVLFHGSSSAFQISQISIAGNWFSVTGPSVSAIIHNVSAIAFDDQTILTQNIPTFADGSGAILELFQLLAGNTPDQQAFTNETTLISTIEMAPGSSGGAANGWVGIGASLADSKFAPAFAANYKALSEDSFIAAVTQEVFGSTTNSVALQNEYQIYKQYYAQFLVPDDPSGDVRAKGAFIADMLHQASDFELAHPGTIVGKYETAAEVFVGGLVAATHSLGDSLFS